LEKKIDRCLERLSTADPDLRRASLLQILKEENFAPLMQTEPASESGLRPVENYLFLPETETPCVLFTAHYDAYPGSTGANDNASSLCILIDLMDALRSRNIPAGFAFLDGEESGHKGAELFRKRKENPVFSSVVSLDLCGYGDTIAVYCRGSRKQPGAAAFCDSERLKTHHGQLVKFLPEGDDIIFSARVQPVLSIAVLPKWDIPYTNALDSYREHLIAKPPEFYTMTGEMEIMTTMHGAFRDSLKWIRPEAMKQVYDYLLDVMTSPPRAAKHSGPADFIRHIFG
jgi:aminopeptidase YwaD